MEEYGGDDENVPAIRHSVGRVPIACLSIAPSFAAC